MGAGEGRPERAAELDGCSTTSPTASARRASRSPPTCPRLGADPRGARPAARRRVGQRRVPGRTRADRRHRAGARRSSRASTTRHGGGVIDTHAHLDACSRRRRARSTARGRPGVDRVITIGTGIDSCRRALALAASNDGVYASLGIHPHQAGGDEAARVPTSSAACSSTRRRSPSARPGSTTTATSAAKDAQRRLFEAQLALAPRARPAVVVHTRAADDDTASMLRALDGTVVMHCFSEPALLAAGARARLLLLLRRQRHLPEGRGASRGRRGRSRPTASSPRRTALTSRRSRFGAVRTSRRTSSTRSRRSPTCAARTRARWQPSIDANATARLRSAVSVRPVNASRARPALPRRREHPRRDRAARRARPEDVVLEIGPGLGVLTTLLADRARASFTRSSSTARSSRTWPHSASGRTSTSIFGDALQLDLAALEPPPDQTRREPALQRRHADRGREPRRAAERSSSGA